MSTQTKKIPTGQKRGWGRIFNLLQSLTLLVFMPTFLNAQQILPNTVYCVKGSEANPVSYCVDDTPCKTFNEHTVCLTNVQDLPVGAFKTSANCWKEQTDYTCMQYQENCTQYSSDSNCTEIGAKACTTGSNGQPMLSSNPKTGECSSYTRNFSCTDPRKPAEESYTQTTECDISGMMGGVDWTVTTKSSADDFVTAATGQEFARQIAVYGAKDAGGVNNIFPGHAGQCRDGYLGLKNCCKSSGGGSISNASLAQKIGVSVAFGGFKQGSGYAAAKGSGLVRDTVMSNAPEFLKPGMQSMFDSMAGNSWQSAGFGAFGFGTTAAAAEGILGSAASQVSYGGLGGTTSFTVGSQQIFFNPYALAAAVAIQLIMEAMSCSEAEKELARARAENLCHYIGDFCSNEIKVFGISLGCLETTQSYCCYNGFLGKAIAEGGRAQIGKSWGSPQGPDCSGFTPAQLSSIDFNAPSMQSAMEPFKQEIMKNFNSNMAPALSSRAVRFASNARSFIQKPFARNFFNHQPTT